MRSLANIITSANKLHASTDAFRNIGSGLLNNRVVSSSDSTSVKATAVKGTELQSGTQKFAITMGNKTTNVSFYAILYPASNNGLVAQ